MTALWSGRTGFPARSGRRVPIYVLTAGISRASDGFNALQAATDLYRDGDRMDDFAARLTDALPPRLAPVLTTLRAVNHATFDRTFLGQDVFEISLLGADRGQPRVIVLGFRAVPSGSGRITVEAHRSAAALIHWNLRAGRGFPRLRANCAASAGKPRNCICLQAPESRGSNGMRRFPRAISREAHSPLRVPRSIVGAMRRRPTAPTRPKRASPTFGASA